MIKIRKYVPLLVCMATLAGALPQTMKAPDITKEPTLYVVPYAHLDTQWRWEFPQTISEYLLKTLRVNFYLLDKYPHYVFNWTGSNRYRLMKEYFPADYARMKQYVAAGRWFPAGSSVEEGDVNLPSAESILRQVLYGNTYFRKEFGKASEEYMLPDCFGFPASLPSLLAHAGVKGFSTQKLNADWQPAPKVGGPGSPEDTPDGIPFNVGIWEGPDGNTVVAALNPSSYVTRLRTDLSKAPETPGWGEQNWPKRIELDGKVTGVYADYHYIGTGDIGGAVDEKSVELLEAEATRGMASLPAPEPKGHHFNEEARPLDSGPKVQVGDGPVHVIPATSDQMFRDLTPSMTARMPRYKGDLELINHSAGSLTSQAYHKRWNRKNELLADAAEKASVAAEWLGGRPYPQKRLNDAWTLVMGGQFHDTGAGTATPRSYEFAWNDDVIALNQFAGVLTSATEAVASAMNTQAKGVALVVYNSLNVERDDVVEASVGLPAGTRAVHVSGPDGVNVPAQVESGKVLFLAKVPATGYAVYDVQPGAAAVKSELKISERSLENGRYRVTLDQNGDVSSVYDKSVQHELLSAPIRLAISNDHPRYWPAWNMDFDQEQAAPRTYVSGPARVRISEKGPARVSLEVTREAEDSKFVQRVSLAAGEAGNRVEFANSIEWRSLSANLKATFPLSASNQNATYNWGAGTVERPSAAERQFEVASHQWIDLMDKSGEYGATILTDCKNGSDKRDDHTIRLTLLRSPGVDRDYTDQANQDWGHHEIVYGLVGHKGGWRDSQADWQGYQLNDPLVAFETSKHAGELGKQFSLLKVNQSHVQVMACKKAETSDDIILRLVETEGKAAPDVQISFAGPLAEAREVNGQEMPIGPATVSNGALVASFGPYQIHTFALKLGAAPAKIAAVRSQPVGLHYDLAVASDDDSRSTGGFDAHGNALPAEMLPQTLAFHGVSFELAPAGTGKANAVIAKGQNIDLPAGRFNRVYVLAASASGDQKVAFRAGTKATEVTVENWGGFIGQWDTRLWKNSPLSDRDWAVSATHAVWDPDPAKQRTQGHHDWAPRYPGDYAGLRPGFIKRADVAWYASHYHTVEGLNQPYAYSYLFAYEIELPANARHLTLPNNDQIRILAVSVAEENPSVKPAQPLYDVLAPAPAAK